MSDTNRTESTVNGSVALVAFTGLKGGYAFTKHHAQGVTAKAAVADLAKPPTDTINSFGACVAVSQCRSRETIRMIRDLRTRCPQRTLAELSMPYLRNWTE